MTNKNPIKSFCGSARGGQGRGAPALVTRACRRWRKSPPLAAGGKKIITACLLSFLLSLTLLLAGQSDITLHREGKKAIFARDWHRAEQLFQQLDTRFPGSIFRVEALYWLAYSLEKQNKKPGALNLLNRLIDTYQNNEWVDDAKILRIRIAVDLITRGEPRYRQYIMEAVQIEDDEHMDLKMVALDALIRLDRQQALVFLERLYKKSKNPGIKENIIFILRRFDENKMISRLTASEKKTGKITISIKDVKEELTEFNLQLQPVPPPGVERRVEPVYPREALDKDVSGAVNLEVRIDKKGYVWYARADKESHPSLAAAAEKAVMQWKFSPSIREGKRIDINCVVTVNFSIEHD